MEEQFASEQQLKAKEIKYMIQNFEQQIVDCRADCDEQREYYQEQYEKLASLWEPLTPIKDTLEKGVKKTYNMANTALMQYKKHLKKLTGINQEISVLESKLAAY